MTELSDVFSPAGLLAAHLPGFSYREPQQRMAELVDQAMRTGDNAVLEAGTGIGKTFAYVVPILLSGQTAIISTGTKTLQDQLFARDLPALGGALGRPVDVALLKGRANYLCRHRLNNALHDGRLKTSVSADIDAIARWGRETDTGDLTEIEDLEDDFRLKARVTSTVDNCLGSQCEQIDQCFVARARRRAQAATIVIVNHHLLLADLSLKESGFGELLPGADTVIVDEAHLLPEIAQQFFDVSVSSRQLTRLGHDIADEAHTLGAGRALESDALALSRGIARLVPEGGKASGRRAGVPPRFATVLADVKLELDAIADQLKGFENEPGLNRCLERCVETIGRLGQVLAGDDAEGLKWFDASEHGFSAHFTPFDISDALAERFAAQGGSWVFTSASLAVGEDFAHFNDRLGVQPGIQAVLPSPFEYPRQGALFLPPDLPEPNQPEYTEALLETAFPLIDAAGGGAFVLFTSHRALLAAESWFAHHRLPGPLFVQGTGSRSRLLEDFRAAGNGILLGTGSFWQGVDVRGPALRVVVIDKLPFAVPSDPLIQARIESIRRSGGEPFRAFQLPEAVLALKQGVGRLIRDFDDRGLVVLGDPRLRSRSYGRVFLDSLPSFARIEDFATAIRFARSLSEEPERIPA
jgi:ATP-dependent DNA helicase DinG